MAQNLNEKIRIKRFIKDIHKKHFLEIYEFARWKSGFTNEDSAKLAQIATMYQNVADSEISAGESRNSDY